MKARYPATFLLVAAVFAGCTAGPRQPGSESSPATSLLSSTGEPSAYNNADVEFVQEMALHQRQGAATAAVASDRSSHPQVIQLAVSMGDSHTADAQALKKWLDLREIQSHLSLDDLMAGTDSHNSEGHDVSAATSADQALAELQNVGQDRVDAVFLSGMIDHHQRALDIVARLQDRGLNPDVLKLAASIAEDQLRSTAELRVLLESPSN